MSKSIEVMWKEGFVNEAHLSAPKVNDLYNRKSQNLVDKLLNMFAVNIKAIVWGCVVMLIIMSLVGAPFLGLYICCLLAPIVIIAKKELKKSVDLSKGQSSYDYIVTFNHWLKNSIKVYSGYYRIFYPLFFLGMATQAIVSKAGGKLIALLLEVFPTSLIILGQPYYIWVALVVGMVFFARYAEAIYQWDLNMVYGHQFKKLEELIADMEELRK
ncbi:hypothetical protein [uncultured Paraglaciecola sp.]|uniref:hypothetical protein n=1 Tax=uncultured Paraglaciecola sp. TaxID=1765024 RepID=UPI0030DD5C9C|tara:strand:+ start:119214 stop:119855 length:642 start_codon:yes stop_codon:yes gene_type:complete